MERHRECLEILTPEGRDGVMIGVRVGGDEAHGHVAMRRALDPTRRENPVRVIVNQQRQHHPRMMLRLAMAAPIDLERANIDPLDRRRVSIPAPARRRSVALSRGYFVQRSGYFHRQLP